jgi:hypothetical protein
LVLQIDYALDAEKKKNGMNSALWKDDIGTDKSEPTTIIAYEKVLGVQTILTIAGPLLLMGKTYSSSASPATTILKTTIILSLFVLDVI